MSAQFPPLLRHFIATLERLQAELDSCFTDKRAALLAGAESLLTPARERETTLARKFEALLEQRQRILDAARQAGLPSESIASLAAAVAPADAHGNELIDRIARAEQTAARLRHESWVQWIVAQRFAQHYNELIEVIAHCGQQSPVYHDRPTEHTSGGLMLDASI